MASARCGKTASLQAAKSSSDATATVVSPAHSGSSTRFRVRPPKKDTVTGAGARMTATRATLSFPGWLNVTAGAAATFTSSTTKATTTNLDTVFASMTDIDDNDDGPSWLVDSSTATLFGSRVEAMYETDKSLALAAPDPRSEFQLLGTATLTAVDTYLGIDFCCNATALPGSTDPEDVHNTLSLVGTSRAFLYSVIADMAETVGKDQDQWLTGIDVSAGATAYLGVVFAPEMTLVLNAEWLARRASEKAKDSPQQIAPVR